MIWDNQNVFTSPILLKNYPFLFPERNFHQKTSTITIIPRISVLLLVNNMCLFIIILDFCLEVCLFARNAAFQLVGRVFFSKQAEFSFVSRMTDKSPAWNLAQWEQLEHFWCLFPLFFFLMHSHLSGVILVNAHHHPLCVHAGRNAPGVGQVSVSTGTYLQILLHYSFLSVFFYPGSSELFSLQPSYRSPWFPMGQRWPRSICWGIITWFSDSPSLCDRCHCVPSGRGQGQGGLWVTGPGQEQCRGREGWGRIEPIQTLSISVRAGLIAVRRAGCWLLYRN